MAKFLGELAIGAKLIDTTSTFYGSPMKYIIADINHIGNQVSWPDSVTLITEKSISIQCFDAKEPDNTIASAYRSYGNNGYIGNDCQYSNIGQWLNSDKVSGEWWTSQHIFDVPPIDSYVYGQINSYNFKNGFLHNFSEEFISALYPNTNIETYIRNPSSSGLGISKVKAFFLPSRTEVNLGNELVNNPEGKTFPIFTNAASRKCSVTLEAIVNSNYSSNPKNDTAFFTWWLRTPYGANYSQLRVINSSGAIAASHAYNGRIGVRPLVNLNYDTRVSDEPDADGYYKLFHNNPPTTPTSITVPENIIGNQAITVSWGTSTDEDGDVVSYKLERNYQNNEWIPTYSGSNTSFVEIIQIQQSTVAYRVKAVDSYGLESSYVTSATRTINDPPSVPATIIVPDSIYANEYITIEWEASKDETNIRYIVERAFNGGSFVQVALTSLLSFSELVSTSWNSVQYRVRARDTTNLESSNRISNLVTIIHNSAPTIPSFITIPESIFSGETITVGWGQSTDPDNNIYGYQLERKIGSGIWNRIYFGNALSAIDTINYGWASVAYRVIAIDQDGTTSPDYRTSETVEIINNMPPVISGEDIELGTFSENTIDYEYFISDVDGGNVYVVEKLNDIIINSFFAIIGKKYNFTISDNTWISLADGRHSFSITATDVQNEIDVRTISFVKEASQSPYSILKLTNIYDKAKIQIETKFVHIGGESENSSISYIDGNYIDLTSPDAHVVFNSNFNVDNQFVMKLKAKITNSFVKILDFTDVNGRVGEIVYCENWFDRVGSLVGYFFLKVDNGFNKYIINSNYISPLTFSKKEIVVAIKYTNNLYEIRCNEIN